MDEVQQVQLVIVRHGQTVANVDGVLQGQSNYPLNDTGRRQASLAGAALSAVPFALAFSSDSSRAHDTALAVMSANRAPVPVAKEPMARERGFGKMEGSSAAAFMEEARSHFQSQGLSQAWMYTPEGGETWDGMNQRAADLFDKLCGEIRREISRRRKGEEEGQKASFNVLLVSHGGFIKGFLAQLAARNCKFPSSDYKAIPSNTAITKIDLLFKENGSLSRMSCSSLHDASHVETLGEDKAKVGGY